MKKLCIKLVIYKDYTEMHGQQNIKKYAVVFENCAVLGYYSATSFLSRYVITQKSPCSYLLRGGSLQSRNVIFAIFF